MKKLVLIATLFLSAQSFAATAVENTVSTSTPGVELSNRIQRRWGTYLSVMGDPAPTLAGLNAAYNVKDYLRLHGGLGQVKATTGITFDSQGLSTTETTVTTVGVGALGMVPGWNLTPVAGLSYTHAFVSGSGLSVSPNNVYASIGGDWQSASGFNFGMGLNVGLVGSVGGFYLNAGWFFM